MPVNNPLLVPIDVEAFVVNEKGVTDRSIQRWKYVYDSLNRYTTPQPKAFSGTNDLPGTGVVLHWTLPEIMRKGVQEADGNIQFPLVPNRWLVVRYSGPEAARSAVAWVVQSDALGNGHRVNGGAPFLDPHAAVIQPTFTGQVVALDNWNEPNPPELFLKAVAPGNNMFASFQPYCWNVFSIYDPLTGVADQDSLSYFVGGWYSKEQDDITGSWQINDNFNDFLTAAYWKLAAASDDTATQAIYHSMVLGIDWDINGPVLTNTPKATDVKIALGNTATDALTALIKAQASSYPGIDAELLEALQYDLLPDYDSSDWEFELKQHIEASWFGSYAGGYAWEIVSRPVDPDTGDPPAPLPPAEREAEKAWLAELNQKQLDYDAATRVLPGLQWNLYQTWWKYNNVKTNNLTNPYPAGTSQAQFQEALDPGNDQSLVSQVRDQQAAVDRLRADISSFIAAKKNPPELKQYARQPFHWAYEPVLLMQGLKNDKTLTPVTATACRFMNQVVTAFLFNGRPVTLAEVARSIPVLSNLQAVPRQMESLVQEFFMLDPGNAAMVAKAALNTTDPELIKELAKAMAEGKNITGDGICPDLRLAKWKQPWSPLIMLWDISWYPIPHDKNGLPLWAFDGNEYTWDGKGDIDTESARGFQSMIFLTPKASFNFSSQMNKFINENPGDDETVRKLKAFIEQIDKWDFLSQSLSGLTPLLNLQNPDPNVSPGIDPQKIFPGKTLADLVAGTATYTPMPGEPQPPVFPSWPPSGFQPWRAGQFFIRRLYVVDRFGQTCQVVNTSTETSFKPVLAPSLQPQAPVIRSGGDRFVQLSPRMLQPGRLNLDLVSHGGDRILDIAADPNPVIAFLLHNYLDESIACYYHDGTILGSVWVITNNQQQQEVRWFTAPGSAVETIEDLIGNPDYPGINELGLMLQQIRELGPPAFNSLLETLDKASLTMDGNQTSTDTGMLLLAGQPVAMVRLRLQLELQDHVITDPSWRFTFAPEPNPVTGWDFTVRLGEAGQRSDGLVGYFYGDKYDVFYTPNLPDRLADPAYILPVGTGESVRICFDKNKPAYLTLLMDPRTAVHATTGILPVTSISIPQEYINDAFSRIDLTFEVGPLLSDTVMPVAETGHNQPVIVSPRPVLKNGKWSWQQLEKGKWETYEIKPAIPTAQFDNILPVIRQGVLRLTGAVKI